MSCTCDGFCWRQPYHSHLHAQPIQSSSLCSKREPMPSNVLPHPVQVCCDWFRTWSYLFQMCYYPHQAHTIQFQLRSRCVSIGSKRVPIGFECIPERFRLFQICGSTSPSIPDTCLSFPLCSCLFPMCSRLYHPLKPFQMHPRPYN